MGFTLEQLAGLLTAGAAWVGLAFSLYNLLQTCPKRRVKVVLARHPEMKGELVGVIFMNERGPEIVIEQVGFEFADGSKIVRFESHFLSPPLPAEVLPGHRLTYYYDLDEVQMYVEDRKSIPVKAYCRDATDHLYKTP